MHSNIIWLLKQCLLSIIETDLDKLSNDILNNVLTRKIIKFSGYSNAMYLLNNSFYININSVNNIIRKCLVSSANMSLVLK